MNKSYINKRSFLSALKQKARSKILSKSLFESIKLNETNSSLNILEFGPGYGDLALSLLNKFDVKTYAFVDISNENLKYVSNLIDNKVNLKVYNHDANYSFSDTDNENIKYDIIVSSHVIEHLSNPSDHLLDIKNLLSKNGICLLSTPNLDSLDSIRQGNNWRGHKDETHISLMGYNYLKSLIDTMDFKLIKDGTSPNNVLEIIYEKNLESIFFSGFKIGDSSNFIFSK